MVTEKSELSSELKKKLKDIFNAKIEFVSDLVNLSKMLKDSGEEVYSELERITKQGDEAAKELDRIKSEIDQSDHWLTIIRAAKKNGVKVRVILDEKTEA